MATSTPTPSLLTVAPTQRELGGLQDPNAHTRAEVVGIGRSAGECAAALLDAAPCHLLLSLGFAGALDPDLRPSDVVVATAYLHGPNAAIASSAHAARAAILLRQAGLSALEGAMLIVDEPLLTPQAKRRAHEGSRALVVDMEGSWIAGAAAARGVPVIVLRAVLDEATFALPDFVATIIADGGRHEWAHAVRALRDPLTARCFLPLALKSRKAARALQIAAGRILPALAAQQ